MPHRLQSNKTKVALAVAVIVLLALVAGTCKRSTEKKPAPAASPATAVVSPLGKFEWTLENNQRAKVADYLGKVIIVDFYATWCQPCRFETPHLVQLQKDYAARGLQVIGLNVGGEDDRAEVPKYVKEFGIQYPMGYPDDNLVDAYLSDSENIPQTFVFDRSGKLVKHLVGYDEDAEKELDSAVQASLAQGQ